MRLAKLPLLTSLLLCAPAQAEPPPAPIKLRMSAIGPEGTAWARELRAFGRDLEDRTNGQVQMKWYFGSIAGDELTALDRIQRGQLDGSAGAQVCDRLAPSLRVTRVLGLFQSRDESSYALGRLRASLDGEFRKSGFVGYVSGMGSDILFTREPVRSLGDLRKSRLWVWNLDEVMISELQRIGASIEPGTVEAAGKAFDDGRTGGFVAIPTAALAFQWSSQAKYFTDLRMAFLPGCVVVANRVFDSLPIAHQQAFREAMAKLVLRFEDLGRAQDQALLGGLFAKQGVRPLPASDVFRSEFFAAARDARAHVDPKLVPQELLLRVESWLADFRAEHR